MDKGARVNKAVKCDTCSITLNSEQQAQQHYSGKNHLKKLRQIGKKKDGESGKDSERRRGKDRGKNRDKTTDKNPDDEDDEDGDSNDAEDGNKDDKTEDDAASKSGDKDDQSDDSKSHTSGDTDKETDSDLEGSEVTELTSEKCDNDDDDDKSDFSQSQNEALNTCDDKPDENDDDSCSSNHAEVLVRAGSPGETSTPSDVAIETTPETDTVDPKPDDKDPPQSPSSSTKSVSPSQSFQSAVVTTATSPVTTTSIISSSATKYATTKSSYRSFTDTNKRPYDSTYQRHSLSTTAALKKPRTSSSYLMPSPHLALTPSSIPGYVSAPTGLPARSDLGLLRPTILTQTPSPSSQLINQATYPTLPYYGNDLSLQPRMAANTAYYPSQQSTLLGQPTAQQSSLLGHTATLGHNAALGHHSATLGHTAGSMSGLDGFDGGLDLLGPQSSYYQTAQGNTGKDLMGQHLTLKYANGGVGNVPGAGYQYGTSIQTISIMQDSAGNLGAGNLGAGGLAGSGLAGSALAGSGLAAGGLPGGGISQGGLFQGSPYASSTPSQYLSLTAPVTAVAGIPATPQIPPLASTSNHSHQMVATTTPAVATAMATPATGESKLDPVSQAVYDNMLGKLPLKRKVQEFPCTICNIVFNSEAQAHAHFTGSRHAKKQKVAEVKEEGPGDGVTSKSWGQPFHCSLCNCTLNSADQLAQHKTGDKHRKKSSMMTSGGAGGTKSLKSADKNKISNVMSWTEVPGHESGWFYCTSCDVSVPTAITLSMHTRGEGHKAKVKEGNIF